MKFTIKHFLCICTIIFCVRSVSISADEETELILVSVIFRHGQRTTYAFFPTDPNINERFYPIGLGGLTNEGKLGEYKLGCYLKNLYEDFLGDVYTEEEVYVRSTDVTRTKMSAQLVLAGLFPPSKIQQWNKDLKWQPIPIAYKPDAEEDLFHPWKFCPYKIDVLENLPEREEVREKYMRPYKATFSYIQEKSGKNMTNPADMQDIFFIFQTESDMGLPKPEWVNNVYPEPTHSIAAQVYGYHNYDQRVKQINAGYMLKKILDDSQTKIRGNSNKKIFLYSGHESTLGYMLNALNLCEPHVPPYGSALSFEVHRGNERFYIKFRYRNATEAIEPVDLVLPGCSLLCPLEQFLELQKDFIPKIPIEEACKRKNIDDAHETPNPTNRLD